MTSILLSIRWATETRIDIAGRRQRFASPRQLAIAILNAALCKET